jgi:hypothetical protein
MRPSSRRAPSRSGSAARSLPERWPALPFAMEARIYGFKAINARTGKGQHGRCPFQSGAEMDARRTRGLVLLAALSLSCAGLAWGVDHAVFASVFVALTAVAVFHAVSPRQRR